MYLPKRKRALLKALTLGGFCFLVVAVSKTASKEIGPSRAISDGDLAVSDSYMESITVTGTVVGIKPAKGNNGVVLLLEGAQGYQLTAYLSQDVGHKPLRVGNRVVVKGSSSQAGLISVTTADGLQVLKSGASTRTVNGIQVRNGVGSWQAGSGIGRAATELPDGYYRHLEVVSDAYGRKVLE